MGGDGCCECDSAEVGQREFVIRVATPRQCLRLVEAAFDSVALQQLEMVFHLRPRECVLLHIHTFGNAENQEEDNGERNSGNRGH